MDTLFYLRLIDDERPPGERYAASMFYTKRSMIEAQLKTKNAESKRLSFESRYEVVEVQHDDLSDSEKQMICH